MYITWPIGTVGAPQLQLVAMDRITLAIGKSETVSDMWPHCVTSALRQYYFSVFIRKLICFCLCKNGEL